ncbi:MAG: hypothetical protein ACO3L7_04665, partial [Poseidonia sp.]
MSVEEETKLPEKEEPVDTRPSLFGTIHLPQRSLSRRYLSARIGKGVFVSIAVMCGIVLVTLLSQISEEAFVPEEEIEVDGVRYPVKTVAQTQLSWKAETYDPTWDADDLRQERSNVTIEASWVETSFEAFNNKGERFTSLQGESTFDLEEDLERALCNSGLAPITYKPVEPWNIFDLLPNEEQEGLAYDTGASTRINIFNRSTAPTAGMGDFWVDSDDGSRWVWKGLRWDSAEDDVFLDGVLEYMSSYPEAFADGKLWVHYTPVEPLFRGDGDLWLNRSATGVSTFSDVELASIYNKSNKSWDIIDFTQLPAAVLDPQSTIKTFVPEFCTKAETSAYILTSGQVGAAVIGEFSNENGYQIEPTADSGRSKTIELTVAITPTGASSSSVSIVDGAFDTAHVELKPSGGLSTHWLFISHTMNYTVTYVQTAGPAADARETSYNEIGGFALGDPLDWFQIRFIDDVDLDNDGIRDVCDDDIDADNAENPVQGHPEHCPGVGRYAMGTTPLSYADWIAQNDENNDGVHDEVKDRDIDGDAVPNLVDAQGHSAEKAFEGRTSLAEIPE